jgi:hypothetical protein
MATGIGFYSKLPKSERWCRIVEEFSRHKLTKANDALPALSGIANWLLNERNKDYAG